MDTIVVEPCEGGKVRNPSNGYQPLVGHTEVPRNAFWLRRLKAGDVSEIKPKSKGKPKK